MDDLKSVTVSYLRDLARKHLGSGHSKLTKKELIAALAHFVPALKKLAQLAGVELPAARSPLPSHCSRHEAAPEPARGKETRAVDKKDKKKEPEKKAPAAKKEAEKKAPAARKAPEKKALPKKGRRTRPPPPGGRRRTRPPPPGRSLRRRLPSPRRSLRRRPLRRRAGRARLRVRPLPRARKKCLRVSAARTGGELPAARPCAALGRGGLAGGHRGDGGGVPRAGGGVPARR